MIMPILVVGVLIVMALAPALMCPVVALVVSILGVFVADTVMRPLGVLFVGVERLGLGCLVVRVAMAVFMVTAGLGGWEGPGRRRDNECGQSLR
ncbi:hypothetical protein [Abyssibacter sp.]|uniref:hypothetical protein n=1 Tax=Abyssibacter sp. TaxID=2320200 RepID=UPI0025BAEA5A|nr:hypothetical protein [Abyssibacter sp.]